MTKETLKDRMPAYIGWYRPHETTGINFPKYGRTQTQFASECDINNILDRYNRTGVLDHVRENVAQYGDFSDIGDYQEQMNTVRAVQEAFAGLPVHIREQFRNDPLEFVQFASDPANRETVHSWGLGGPGDAKASSGEVIPPPTPDASVEAENTPSETE